MTIEKPHMPNIDDVIKPIEVLHIPELRISSASFSRILDTDGRYALLINKNRVNKGKLLLTPIGGAIEANADGIAELKNILNISEADFEKGNDLRFKIDGENANKYRKWFLSGKNRESDPVREFIEELTEEENILTKDDLKNVSASLAGYNTQFAKTSRVGKEGAPTLRFLEIFDVIIDAEVLAKLVENSKKEISPVRFVTEKEIRDGRTTGGIEIKPVSLSLLDTQNEIEEFS